MEKNKQIIIKQENGKLQLESRNMNTMEILGVLRFFEKKLFIDTIHEEKEKEDTQETSPNNK